MEREWKKMMELDLKYNWGLKRTEHKEVRRERARMEIMLTN